MTISHPLCLQPIYITFIASVITWFNLIIHPSTKVLLTISFEPKIIKLCNPYPVCLWGGWGVDSLLFVCKVSRDYNNHPDQCDDANGKWWIWKQIWTHHNSQAAPFATGHCTCPLLMNRITKDQPVMSFMIQPHLLCLTIRGMLEFFFNSFKLSKCVLSGNF